MKKTLTKTGILATLLTFVATGIFGQTLPNTQNPPAATDWTEFIHTGTHDETIDSVTVGSRMPYRVDAQTPITGLSFEYKWLFSEALTIEDYNGITFPNTSAPYYGSNEISVIMPTTTGDITITTNVRTLMGSNVLCEAIDVTNTIRVLPRPTVKWAATGPIVGCSSQDVTIPLTLTGNEQFEVAYNVEYYDTYDKSGGLISSSSGYIVLTGNNLDFSAATFPNDGLYEISMNEITDRISRKSLDMDLVKSEIADLPDNSFQVIVYPTPVTNPLQHIRNN